MSFNGRVYQITVPHGGSYIGSTRQTLRQRMIGHKYTATNSLFNGQRLYPAMVSAGVDNCTITLLEQVRCNSRQELLQREQHYIDQLNPELNLNRAYVPLALKRLENKDACRTWRENNAEHARDYKARYLQQARQRHRCNDCNQGFGYPSDLNRHMRSRKHMDQMVSKLFEPKGRRTRRQWYQDFLNHVLN